MLFNTECVVELPAGPSALFTVSVVIPLAGNEEGPEFIDVAPP